MLNPDYARAYVGRSNAYQALNWKEEALEDLQRAERLTSSTPQPSSAKDIKVYLYYNDPDDKAMIMRIAEDLKTEGYDVQKEELRPERTKGQVLYFTDGESKVAEEIRQRVENSLSDAKSPLQLTAIYSPIYTGPAGRMEVWLPPLQKR